MVSFSGILEYQSCKVVIEVKGWTFFLQNFQGYNDAISLAFAQTFDVKRAKVGNLQLKITEQSCSEAIGLPSSGDHFFNGGQLHIPNYAVFLKLACQLLIWAKGVLRTYIQDQWNPLLTMIQCFLTYEGRYAIVFLYHIRLLKHFTEEYLINIPHFLKLSPHKMARGVKSKGKKPNTFLYFHNLIKILIVAKLTKRKNSCEDFLIENFLGEEM